MQYVWRSPISGMGHLLTSSGVCAESGWRSIPDLRQRDIGSIFHLTTSVHSTFVMALDCLAEPVIGRAFARPVGSQ
jgi:hypothetical protein